MMLNTKRNMIESNTAIPPYLHEKHSITAGNKNLKDDPSQHK